jgi:hypothetical protein
MAVASAYLILLNIQISELVLMCYAQMGFVIYAVLRIKSYYCPKRHYYTYFCIEDAVFFMQLKKNFACVQNKMHLLT